MLINALNALSEDAAVAELLHCCGSTRWARRMAAARPLPSFEAMSMAADRIWASLEPEDWLEAFRTHPRIGELGGADGAGGVDHSSPLFMPYRSRIRRATAVLWTSSAPS